MLPHHLTTSSRTLPTPFSRIFRSHNTLSSSSHSFSKVLFSFPSQYFFSIGFPVIFRLWWILSPLQFILPNKFTLFPMPLFSRHAEAYEAFTLSGWLFHSIPPFAPLLSDSVLGYNTIPVSPTTSNWSLYRIQSLPTRSISFSFAITQEIIVIFSSFPYWYA